MKRRRLEIIPYALALLVAPIAALTFFVPIYTDEVLWKVLLGRYGDDGGQELFLTLIPWCGAYAKAVPAILLPFRYFYQSLFGNMAGPLFLRIMGLAFEYSWLLLTWVLMSGVTRSVLSRWQIAIGVLGFTMLGIMPFMMAISRPEQILLLGLTILFIPMLAPTPNSCPVLSMALIYAVLTFILFTFLLASHPRAIFLFPLFVVFLQRVSRHRVVVYPTLCAMSVFGVLAYSDWSARWSCPGDVDTAIDFQRLNLGANLKSPDIFIYFDGLLKVYFDSSSWFIPGVIQKSFYTSNIFPKFSDEISIYLGKIVFSYLGFASIIAFSVFIWIIPRVWPDKNRRATVFALGSVWLLIFLSTISRIDKNDYESELLVPAFGLVIFGTFWLAHPELKSRLGTDVCRRIMTQSFLILQILAVSSQIDLLVTYSPDAFGSWSSPAYPTGQRFSISGFGFPAIREKILHAAAKCGLFPEDRPKHLVVDELTYFAFQQAYQPFFMTDLDEKGWSFRHPDPTPILRRFNAAGMIIGCHWTPTAYRQTIIDDGNGFCCMPAFNPP